MHELQYNEFNGKLKLISIYNETCKMQINEQTFYIF